MSANFWEADPIATVKPAGSPGPGPTVRPAASAPPAPTPASTPEGDFWSNDPVVQQPATTISTSPNLTGLPVVGPVLGMMGYNGAPKVEEAGPDPQARYDAALEKVRLEQYPGMDPEKFKEYAAKALAPYGPTELSQHAALYGTTDEISAGLGAIGSQARQMVTGKGPGFGEAFGVLEELEQARRDLGRAQQGALGTAAEIAGGVASMGRAVPTMAAAAAVPSTVRQAAAGAVKATVPAAAYGFGATDGDLGDRAVGAVETALPAAGVGAAIPIVANTVARVGANRGAANTVKQALAQAPTSAEIKATSKASYKAAEKTGAVVDQPAMNLLQHDVRTVLSDEGLLLPDGSMAGSYPKVTDALKAVDSFSAGPLSVKQAQTVGRILRRAAGSKDPDEARIGAALVDEFDNFIDGLPATAFSKGDGVAAAEAWKKGRADYHRAKRTQAMEGIIANAKLHDGGFAAGLRNEFKSILKSERKARRFTPDELDQMRAFVEGDGLPLTALLKKLRSGSPFVAGLAGHLLGGPALGAVTGIGEFVAKPLAARALDKAAMRGAEFMRANAALPGGMPVPTVAPAQVGAPLQRVSRGVVPVMAGPRTDWMSGEQP